MHPPPELVLLPPSTTLKALQEAMREVFSSVYYMFSDIQVETPIYCLPQYPPPPPSLSLVHSSLHLKNHTYTCIQAPGILLTTWIEIVQLQLEPNKAITSLVKAPFFARSSVHACHYPTKCVQMKASASQLC